MLCVGKVRAGGHAYYLDVVDTGIEAPGEWLSAGARERGLAGTVMRGDLEAVLGGRDPVTAAALGRSRDRVTVAGFDLTFCAPKSVSVLHALADDEVASEVQAGHRQAVRAAVSYVERHGVALRRSVGGERRLESADAVAGAGFLHRTSRALDPHLHTHVVVANLGRDIEGIWRALDGRGIYAHAPTAGALYHVQLRHELTRRIGVEWGPLDRGRADIEGIGSETRAAFSRRAAAIQAHLARRGLTGPHAGRSHTAGNASGPAGPSRSGPSGRARAVAAFATRAPRDPELSPETLRGWWRQRALDAGLSPRGLDAVLGRARATVLDDITPRRRALEHMAEAALAERGRSVTRREVVRTWCGLLARGAPARSVEQAAESQLTRLEPLDGPAGGRDGPGVGERRHFAPVRALEPPTERDGADDRRATRDRCDPRDRIAREALAERLRIDRMLGARGMTRPGDLFRTIGRDDGFELGR